MIAAALRGAGQVHRRSLCTYLRVRSEEEIDEQLRDDRRTCHNERTELCGTPMRFGAGPFDVVVAGSFSGRRQVEHVVDRGARRFELSIDEGDGEAPRRMRRHRRARER